jgi:hypothetical protein
VPIEKAFAIEAEPSVIWDALWSELSEGEEGAFAVEESHRPHMLSVRVRLGGLPALLTYRIEGKDGHSETSATLEPLSFKYNLYQFLTLGQSRRNYELILVQGLANLKEAVEHGVEVPPDGGEDAPPG